MSWKLQQWKSVLEIKSGRSQKQVKNQDGKYPIYGSGGIMGYADDFICNEGTTIIGRKGTINKPIYVEEKFWNVDTAFGLSPSKYLYSKFLYYFCLGYDFTKHDKGTTLPSLVKKDLLANVFMAVPSLEEQKRIVEILDEVFQAIALAETNTKKNLANARELFESYLNSALIKFVQGKTIQTLTDITELIIDCEHKTAPTQETGFPSIRTPNIGKGHLILDNVYRVSEKTYNAWTRRGKPQSGDLILAREAPAGNVGVIPKEEKVCLGQRTVLIKPKKDINSQYLAFFLLHSAMQKRLLSKSSGATVQHVNMKDIRALKISEFPSVEVQQKFVDYLLNVQLKSRQLEDIYQQKLEALAELKQSILQKAFTGQLPPASLFKGGAKGGGMGAGGDRL